MKEETEILRGWQAVPVFLMLVVTPVVTALVMSLPIGWLVNHLFAIGTIHAIFGVDHLGYWRVVGLFALCYATRFKIKVQGPSVHRNAIAHSLTSHKKPISQTVDTE